ncbi:DUF1294 domain-containing protein [Sphingomonas sp. IC-56]|uniref:DUF1294 domain-containing protein n=1 Tax=Sphingomonas sp. IC-56 TaxID=2898529 RepID=UPI002ED9AA10
MSALSPPVLMLGITLLVLVNLWTLLSFRDDKQRAVRGDRRILEKTLLWLALIGGTPAAFFARQRFRHKTRKEPFSTYLQLIAMVQVGVIGGLGWSFAA